MNHFELAAAQSSLVPTAAERAARKPNVASRLGDRGLSVSEFTRRLSPQRPPDPTTLRRWKSGRTPIPPWVTERVKKLLDQRPTNASAT